MSNRAGSNASKSEFDLDSSVGLMNVSKAITGFAQPLNNINRVLFRLFKHLSNRQTMIHPAGAANQSQRIPTTSAQESATIMIPVTRATKVVI